MKQIMKKLIMGSDKNIMKKSAAWNLISSVEYSVQSIFLLMIVTRVSGLLAAGVFNIAYTVTQMMSTIGSYGMRSFQVSDTKDEYPFTTYFTSRIVSTAAMIIICISYALFQGYNAATMSIVVWFCGYRVIEVIEDVIHGEMQKRNRLDVAAKIASVRIFIASLVFTVTYVISGRLFISSFMFTLSAFVLILIMNMCVVEEFGCIKLHFSKVHVFRLLIVCLPLCISGFLYNYLVNAPKYAIARNMSDEMQALFSILYIPIFAINMLSSFIFKPMIAGMGVTWNNGDCGKFVKTVIRQLLIIVGLTLAIAVAGGLFGIDILGRIFAVDLTMYRFLFTILMLYGGLSAIVAFMVVVLTIMRRQNYIIVAYGVAMAVDLLFIDRMVINFSLAGAGAMYGMAMGIITVILLTVFVVTMRKRR